MAHRASFPACLCLFALAALVTAQTPAGKNSQRLARSQKLHHEEVDAVAAQREVLAISLLAESR